MQQLQPSSSAALVESRHHLNGAQGSGARPGPDSSSSGTDSSGGGGDGGADSPDQLELHVEAVVSTLSRVTDSVADVLKSLHLVTAQLDVIANKLCSQCSAAASFDGGDAASNVTVCGGGGGVRRGWRPTMNARCSLAEAGGGATRWRLPSYAASESAGGNGGCCSGDEGESGYGGEGDAPRLSYPSESHSDDCGGSGGGVGGYCDDDKLSDSIGAVVASPVSSPQCGGSRGGAQALAGGEPQPRSVSAQGLDEPHELDWDVNGLELSSSPPPPHDGYGRGGVGSESSGCDRHRTDASDVDPAAASSAAAAYRDVPQQRLSHSFTSPAFSSSYGSLSDSCGGGCGGGGDGGGGAYEFKVVLLQSLSEHEGWCRSDVRRPLSSSSCRRRQPLPIAAPLYGSAYETQMESALESSALRSDTPSTEDDYDENEMGCGAVHDGDSAAVHDDDDENEDNCRCVAGGAEVAATCGSYGKRRDRSSPPSEPVTFRMGSAASVADDNDARGSSADVESTDLTTAVAFGDVQPVGRSLDAGGARWASYDRDVNTWQSFTLAHSDDTSDGRATPGGAGSSASSTPRPLRSAAASAPQQPPAETTPLSSQSTPKTAGRLAVLPATESACPASRGQRSRELPVKLSALTGRLREKRRVRMSERQPVFV